MKTYYCYQKRGILNFYLPLLYLKFMPKGKILQDEMVHENDVITSGRIHE